MSVKIPGYDIVSESQESTVEEEITPNGQSINKEPNIQKGGMNTMEQCEMRIETPRGAFNIHTIFKDEDNARAMGWGLWFQHGKYLILAKDNRVGAVVEQQ